MLVTGVCFMSASHITDPDPASCVTQDISAFIWWQLLQTAVLWAFVPRPLSLSVTIKIITRSNMSQQSPVVTHQVTQKVKKKIRTLLGAIFVCFYSITPKHEQ